MGNLVFLELLRPELLYGVQNMLQHLTNINLQHFKDFVLKENIAYKSNVGHWIE